MDDGFGGITNKPLPPIGDSNEQDQAPQAPQTEAPERTSIPTSPPPSAAPSAPAPQAPTAAPSEPVASDDDKLKEFLDQKRASEVKPAAPTGLYSDDPMARRYLLPILKYMERDDIENFKELIINKPGQVIMEDARGKWIYHDDPALTLDVLEDMARVLANRTGQLYHPGKPILSCKFEGGHRVQIVGGFNTITGFIMSIRIQRKETFTIDDFHMTPEDKEKVIEAITGHKTILISGGTGTGKTSFMNAVLPYVQEEDRLVTLEDVPELRITQPNWCPMIFSNNDTGVGNQDIKDLLNATLRLRPDRIILGEIRKENAFTFCSAINTGHEGSMATIHANNPATALDAVINRVLLNGDTAESALGVLRRQLIADIYGVVQLKREGARISAYFHKLEVDDPTLKSKQD
ncbi:MAG: ATPase, T2SS/T4P/T4SS family [Pseudomonadota bacterium]|nr:ATPase, T2SS/T4P/T4SS family [Pseudomonadota bacterium]